MFVYPNTTSVEFTSFTNCVNLEKYGGALFISDSIILIRHCICTGCAALMGGFLFTSKSDLTLTYSYFANTRCTYIGDLNIGGNIVCEDSGTSCYVTSIQALKCAPEDEKYGESMISSKASNNTFSFLNISKSYGEGGGFVSIRDCKEKPIIRFLNLCESRDFTMIENIKLECLIYYSNFIKNNPYSAFLRLKTKSINCVFLHNANIYTDPETFFIDCIGTFYSNVNNISDTSTIQYPRYQFIKISRKQYKYSMSLTLLCFVILFNKC